jgi:hypothetical protein
VLEIFGEKSLRAAVDGCGQDEAVVPRIASLSNEVQGVLIDAGRWPNAAERKEDFPEIETALGGCHWFGELEECEVGELLDDLPAYDAPPFP